MDYYFVPASQITARKSFPSAKIRSPVRGTCTLIPTKLVSGSSLSGSAWAHRGDSLGNILPVPHLHAVTASS